MSNLVQEHCDGAHEALDESEAARLDSGAPAWTRDQLATLKREFEFENFRDAFGFVARLSMCQTSVARMKRQNRVLAASPSWAHSLPSPLSFS